MLTRVLPGSAVVVAALIIPEFSVGAGDISRNDGVGDPPEPAAAKDQAAVKPGLAKVRPGLAGVRYAAMLDFDGRPSQIAALPLASPVSAIRSGNTAAQEILSAPSLPVSEPEAPAFVTPPVMPLAPAIAEAAGVLPEPAAPASFPIEPAVNVAAVLAPMAVAAPAAAPVRPAAAILAAAQAPSLPAVEPKQVSFVSPASLPAAAVVAAPARVSASVPAEGLAAVPAPPISPSPAGRGAIEQLTPARIAAAQSAPRRESSPALKSVAVAAVAAPGLRPEVTVPVTASAPAPKPAAARPAPVPAPAAAAVIAAPVPKPALAAPPSAASSPLALTAQLVTRVDGKTAGSVDFQQTSAGLKVRLGSIAEVLSDRFNSAQLARIRGSAAGNAYLSLAELQAQGIPISYDPVYDEFNVGLTDTRPKAARKVHMDQISAPERGLGATGMDQVRR